LEESSSSLSRRLEDEEEEEDDEEEDDTGFTSICPFSSRTIFHFVISFFEFCVVSRN
jgi:hypothetical protein